MKMLFKRNILESLAILSCSGIFVCILLHYTTNISPIQGVWFTIYTLTVFFLSILFSFKFIQWLLSLHKPIKYDLDKILEQSPHLNVFLRFLPDTRKSRKPIEFKEYDTNELSVISNVLEKKLVSSWYVPYISQEISFPFACKQMLDQMIGKAFQICHKIDTKDVYVDICMILTSHLKEYRKAMKRHEKCTTETVESLYKKTHQISDVSKRISSTDHCTNLVRVILKELVPWELWDTPHSELLVHILSKKLDGFIKTTLVDPVWLNDKLLTLLKGKEESRRTESKDDNTEEIVKKQLSSADTSPKKIVIEQTVIQDVKDPLQSQRLEGKVGEFDEELSNIKSSPILRQCRGRQGRNEVKIYDRIIEGSVKTWETDMDLQCISLGQDLLASLDGEITLSRLWGQEGSPNPPRVSSPQPLWFGEEDMDIELESSPHKDGKKESSPKPGDALLKDIQSTVSQAKTKIGDLQVGLDVHKQSGDEAAGMMEGLLDFGIAGLRKGLRFTGLSDDSQSDKSPSHKHPDRYGDKTPPESRLKPSIEQKETVFATVTQKDDNGGGNAHPLLKQQRLISQDSVPSQPKPIIRSDFPPAIPTSDSPEPQYEEVADLSTSIAKLRTLLQQRAQIQRTEDVWWESAEETRGRTQHHHSSKPIDTATLADEYDMNLERNSSPGQATNNMQRLDKLFQRTVTGVFNSIKTAVGAEDEEVPPPRQHHDWVYVCTSAEHTVGGAVAKLVGSRRDFTHVDAALDSLEQLGHPPRKTQHVPEDFEEWCSYVGDGWCAAWGVAEAAKLTHSHVTHRIATLLFADIAESLVSVWLDDLTVWLKDQVFVNFRQMTTQDEPVNQTKRLRKFDMEETCRAVLDRVPLLYIFGEETLTNAVKLPISSFSHKGINMDVVFRMLDLLALHFKNSACQRNPSFDGN